MKLDPKTTEAVQRWLDTPEHERDLREGADLMLSLNRNRALYNSVLRHPAKFMPKLVYELKKHLRIRLDNMAVADVARMENTVMPAVERTLSAPVISTDDELPEGRIALGRRADHDLLPEDIRLLWETNGDRYRRIRLLYNELKAMHDSQPCDRYEKLVILDDLDKKYRAALEKYDGFVLPSPSAAVAVEPSSEPDTAADDGSGNSDDLDKTVNNARKTLSKYRKALAGLAPDDPKRQTAIDKIQAAVSSILAAGAGVADGTKSELAAIGVKFE